MCGHHDSGFSDLQERTGSEQNAHNDGEQSGEVTQTDNFESAHQVAEGNKQTRCQVQNNRHGVARNQT